MTNPSDIHQNIQRFLGCHRIAMVGVSRNDADFSCAIRKKFWDAGFEVYGVNPAFDADEVMFNYPNLGAIPGPPVEAVFMATAGDVTDRVVRECKELGIDLVWMHKGIGKGSTSEDAVNFCRQNGIAVIPNGCPMMFVEPVDGFHKTLRWFKGLKPKRETGKKQVS